MNPHRIISYLCLLPADQLLSRSLVLPTSTFQLPSPFYCRFFQVVVVVMVVVVVVVVCVLTLNIPSPLACTGDVERITSLFRFSVDTSLRSLKQLKGSVSYLQWVGLGILWAF